MWSVKTINIPCAYSIRFSNGSLLDFEGGERRGGETAVCKLWLDDIINLNLESLRMGIELRQEEALQ